MGRMEGENSHLKGDNKTLRDDVSHLRAKSEVRASRNLPGSTGVVFQFREWIQIDCNCNHI